MDLERLALDLRGAAARGEIVAVYQPEQDLTTGRIVAVESLSRWNHPTLGPIAPTTFIPLAEQSQLIHEVGDFMLEDGCRNAAEWQRGGYGIEVAINVAARQLATATFYERLQHLVSALSLNPYGITIEVTESQVIADHVQVAGRLGHLRELGLGVSIDDFGTGYSSVEQVLTLPANELKIDRSLVQNGDPTKPLLAAVVELAHERGLRVVAEGIETEEHLRLARDIHCDRVQGFLIGRPTTRQGIDRLISKSA
ncbi:MAG: hypothetical protein JWQ12_1013 [Glaciihabitans sp.]|nr:hypothetical protein [Glaciihabitans sp.]